MGQQREHKQETTPRYAIVKHVKRLTMKRNTIKLVLLKSTQRAKIVLTDFSSETMDVTDYRTTLLTSWGKKKAILEFCVQQRCIFKNKEKQ